MHVTLLNASPKITEMFFGRTSMKKKHDTICIATFLLAQNFIKMYFTEMYYYVMFSKLLYFNEEVW